VLLIYNTEGLPSRGRRKPQNLSQFQRQLRGCIRVECERVRILGEILAKFFAIGIVGAGTFVMVSVALSNNWL
jgi:hypothetical protein